LSIGPRGPFSFRRLRHDRAGVAQVRRGEYPILGGGAITAYAANAGVSLPTSQAIETVTSAVVTLPTMAPSDGTMGGIMVTLSCFGYSASDNQRAVKFGVGIDESTAYTSSEQIAILGLSGVGSGGVLIYRAPMTADNAHTIYALASNGSVDTAETIDCSMSLSWTVL
jgi:hypothetical protein